MAQRNWRKYLKFRCTGCGNCCRDTVVLLTDADVRRIREGTGKPVEEFVHFFSVGAVEMGKRHPLWVRFSQRRATMGLKWKEGHCGFLDDDNNRCTIYEHRPVTCREHPFNVTLSETGAVERLSISRIVPCPYELDGKQTLRGIKSAVYWNHRQSEVYHEKIRKWNRRREGRRTPREFLRFLGLTD
jgi:Fe-S-cluster containining protein